VSPWSDAERAEPRVLGLKRSVVDRGLMVVTVYGALRAVQNVSPGMALKVVYQVEPTTPEFEDVSAH
jgi:hypothetical protein